MSHQPKQKIAVIGSGISGLSAAWLLAKRHSVSLFEREDRLGGHTNTVNTDDGPVDTGFIVYNTQTYPNLIAFFDHLGVATCETDMSFSVSADNGRFEYAGSDLKGLLAQKRNAVNPTFWRMLRDIVRFYRQAPQAAHAVDTASITLGDFLHRQGYGDAFIRNHLIPMGAAIWSTPPAKMLDYPLAAFVRFCENHGLLKLTNRPAWRTVIGGGRQYVNRIEGSNGLRVQLNTPIKSVWRHADGVTLETLTGHRQDFDQVVFATHADQTARLLLDASEQEARLLAPFEYQRNRAILHTDASLMPKRKAAWASWNYLSTGTDTDQEVCVTYWMNSLQPLNANRDYFVTLNPVREPREGTILRSFLYDHPVFSQAAIETQPNLWRLQGVNRAWFCGSYFGYGFHEDGIQSGLAVAEAIGGLRRPWQVQDGQDRVNLPPDWRDRWLRFRKVAA